jgi:Plasmid pRiA4b ORF-3-like protein
MPSKKRSHNGKQGSHRPDEAAQTRSRTDKSSQLFQFKITLLEITPPIWRQIQVPDCTLGELHKVIQAAMGWENCHLHRFIIDGVRYGVPEPDLKLKNEDKVLLSQIVLKSGKGFRFRYEYDFGDGWMHDVVFEGNSPNEVGQNFPVCLDGSRACPPEDCGGPYGYPEFLEAIVDPKHERHAELLQWVGGKFDPEQFDAKTATVAMMKVLRGSK